MGNNINNSITIKNNCNEKFYLKLTCDQKNFMMPYDKVKHQFRYIMLSPLQKLKVEIWENTNCIYCEGKLPNRIIKHKKEIFIDKINKNETYVIDRPWPYVKKTHSMNIR